MDELLLVLIMVVGFFVVFLLIQSVTKRKFCALCGAVMLSWIILLLLYWKGIFEEQLLIALLLGGSIVGVYYLVEKKVPERFTLFRLPFLLTLIVFGFILLKGFPDVKSVLLILVLWILFSFIYLFRQNLKLQAITKKMIECCQKW